MIQLERLEMRQLMSAASLAVGNVLYTTDDHAIYRSNLDGTNQLLLHQWAGGNGTGSTLVAFGNKVLFSASADDTMSGLEPWVTNGTVAGTQLLGDLHHYGPGSNPHGFSVTSDNKYAIFLANTATQMGDQIFVTDGTAGGTRQISLTGYLAGSAPANVVISDSKVDYTEWLGGSSYNEHYSYDVETNAQDNYTVSTDGTIKAVLYQYDETTTVTIHQDANGRIEVQEGSLQLSYRPQDVNNILIQDELAATEQQDNVTVDPSVTLPLTFIPYAGNDTLAGGSGENTVDLSKRTTSDGAMTIDSLHGIITFESGATVTLKPGQYHVIGVDGAQTDVTVPVQDATGGGTSTGGTGTGNSTPPPTINAHVSNGILRVYGTDAADAITLVGDGSNVVVTVNGVSKTFALSGLTTAVVNGLDGDDDLVLTSLTLKSRLYGGDGNDTIYGGAGKDRIYGGDGNDWISGGDNHDTLYGEAGNDKLFGDGGHDYLVAGAGVDTLRGGTGFDHLVYASGDDVRANAGDRMSVDAIVG